MTSAKRTARVIEISRSLGFDLCGVAPAEKFPELAHLEEWLGRGYAGEMRYLHDARRHQLGGVVVGIVDHLGGRQDRLGGAVKLER